MDGSPASVPARGSRALRSPQAMQSGTHGLRPLCAGGEPGSPTTHTLDDLRPAGDAEPVPADVEALVAMALHRNPGLAAAERRVERLRTRRAQVTSLEDPMLSVTPLGEMAQTAAGEVGLMAGVSQAFPFPGKLGARGDAADRAAAGALADLADQRLRVAAAVRRAWWSLAYARQAGAAAGALADLADQRLRVAAAVRRAWWSLAYARQAAAVVEEDVGLRTRLRDSAAARYRAGDAGRADVLRAGVEVDALEQDLLGLRQQAASAGASLNQLLDRPAASELPEPAAATLGGVAGTLDDLLAAAAGHPRLASLKQEIAASRDRLRLAGLERYPDFNVGVSYAEVDDEGLAPMANGDNQWSVTFGLNLPLWQGRRDAAEAEALAGLGEAAALYTDEQNRLAFAVTDALARAESRRAAVTLYDADMLPAAEEAVAASAAGYRAGRTDFIELIDNARRLTALKLLRLQAVTQLQQDLADLREAVGTPEASLRDRTPQGAWHPERTDP